MSGYAIDPTQPLPKRWTHESGDIRLLCQPYEGYVMARKKGAAPFILSVRDLLSGTYRPAVKREGSKP